MNHSVLLAKLEANGIHGSLFNWLKSYLERRSQIVAVLGYESQVYSSDSGVPQGSHLGPVLFALFISDLPDVIINSKCSMFADDTKIYKTIHTPTDTDLLQDDLDRLTNWCHANDMTINTKKCYHITFTRKKQPITSTYKIESEELQKVKVVKDLGVWLDSELNFIEHIDKIVSKSAQMLGFLKRNSKQFRFTDTRILLFNTLVRSNLEYACSVWNPTYAVHSQRIEQIQRAFTRHLAISAPNISHRCPYSERLNHFNILSLHDRRKMHDVIFLYKILNNLIDSSEILSSLYVRVPFRPPRYPVFQLLRGPSSRTNLGSYAAINRMCNTYNLLNRDTDNLDIFCDSLKVFKDKMLKLFKD